MTSSATTADVNKTMSSHHPDITTFIRALSEHAVGAESFNPYHDATRRNNLHLYLEAMQKRQPSAFMLMEAPGYRGCRLTGIPVTSRKVMLEGVPELDLFGIEQGYADVDEAGFEDIWGEQSATIVWNTLADIGHAPLIWNAYPFHPHKPSAPRTNRKPRKRTDLAPSTPFLETLLAWFQPSLVLAIGNVAHEALGSLGIEAHKIRHPAQGGKSDFVAGMEDYLKHT
jgi:hypothetical protein